MRGRRPEVDVEDADGDDDGQRHQDHGEDEVLAEQRHGQRRRRDDLGQQQKEDGQRHQDGDAQRHLTRRQLVFFWLSTTFPCTNTTTTTTTNLLARVGRQVEDEDRQKGDAHARDDQVDRVEQRLAPHRHVERDV